MLRPLATLLAAAALLAALPATARAVRLPLGARDLPQLRVTRHLARGVTLTQYVRGRRPHGPQYAVDVGFAVTRAEAAAVAARLSAQGERTRIRRVVAHAPDDPRPGPVGYVVRVPGYATQADAQAAAMRLEMAGAPDPRAVNVGEDAGQRIGPWRIRVLDVNLARFSGRVRARLATGVVPGRETVTSLDRRTGALAGVNGGYFTIGEVDGTPGDPAGISVLRGRLVSEAVNGRTSLLLRPRHARIRRLSSAIVARADQRSGDEAAGRGTSARRRLDGRNRTPGLIRSCGGTGGDRPTQRPLHDVTCTDGSEVIEYTRAYGRATPGGAEVESVLDARGRVVAQRLAGGPIPRRGSVLAGTGSGAAWLRAHARLGRTVRVRATVRSGRRAVALTRRLDVVNGGPRLLRAGRRDITAAGEGFQHPGDPTFYLAFGVRRNPRTMAGITRRGHLLLVVADGHAPGYAIGLTFKEEARVMRALGARDAVNLDGGGSTTMALRGRLLNRPSDATGERPVGDAIALER